MDKIYNDFNESNKNKKFELFPNVVEEILRLEKNQILHYIINRYKYDVFPIEKRLSDYPPNLQIEIASICNFRCIFCYQTDNLFNKKSNGFMGQMDFKVFKKIIDEVEGKIQFITLASRGEPTLCKDFSKMLSYVKNKFLGFKVNTNASMLNEDKIHAILNSNISTLVISADAAEEKEYSKYRVNGDLKKIISNLKKFNQIKNDYYPNSKIITRVSGVKFSSKQDYQKLKSFWSEFVDQVAFVNYLPWENIYIKEKNGITTPCTDLWRRMFIWWDGYANPCDVDYKSNMKLGNIFNNSIKEIWNSSQYNDLRKMHLNSDRQKLQICSKCNLV